MGESEEVVAEKTEAAEEAAPEAAAVAEVIEDQAAPGSTAPAE
jgi:hypothetical protein